MLSDGVFAIAATLLVLELKIPESADHLPIAAALLHVIPSLLAYALSFFVIALFWSAYHRAMSLISEVDRPIVYLNLVLLFLISLQPFPTALLGRYGNTSLAVALYAIVMALTGATLRLIWARATSRPDLLQVDAKTPALRAARLRLSVVSIVFVLSVPIAYWHPAGAMACWGLVLVFSLVSRIRHR